VVFLCLKFVAFRNPIRFDPSCKLCPKSKTGVIF
jgi:hypothetical protein